MRCVQATPSTCDCGTTHGRLPRKSPRSNALTPCRRCQRSAITSCVLTRPVSKTRHSRPGRKGANSQHGTSVSQDSTTRPRRSQSPVPHRFPPSSRQQPPDYAKDVVDAHIESLAHGVILKEGPECIHQHLSGATYHASAHFHGPVLGTTLLRACPMERCLLRDCCSFQTNVKAPSCEPRID